MAIVENPCLIWVIRDEDLLDLLDLLASNPPRIPNLRFGTLNSDDVGLGPASPGPQDAIKPLPMARTLPEPFAGWFAAQGWAPRRHQLAMLDAARAGDSVLLIAPTGGGKTLAGFLPSLIELTERRRKDQDLAHKKGKGELFRRGQKDVGRLDPLALAARHAGVAGA